MKVFISWSGERSRAIGECFRKWIPSVLQAAKPYFSPDDIQKGSRWSKDIAGELQASEVGLLIVTADNFSAPWLMFEAGALSKHLDTSRVCPILFDVNPSDITGPLTQFQMAKFDRAEIERVIRMMNQQLQEALDSEVLDQALELHWPKLSEKIDGILTQGPSSRLTSRRADRDVLEEVLELVRGLTKGAQEPVFQFTNATSATVSRPIEHYFGAIGDVMLIAQRDYGDGSVAEIIRGPNGQKAVRLSVNEKETLLPRIFAKLAQAQAFADEAMRDRGVQLTPDSNWMIFTTAP